MYIFTKKRKKEKKEKNKKRWEWIMNEKETWCIEVWIVRNWEWKWNWVWIVVMLYFLSCAFVILKSHNSWKPSLIKPWKDLKIHVDCVFVVGLKMTGNFDLFNFSGKWEKHMPVRFKRISLVRIICSYSWFSWKMCCTLILMMFDNWIHHLLLIFDYVVWYAKVVW